MIVLTAALVLSTNVATLTPQCLDETPAEHLQRSSAVFAGRVLKVASSGEMQIVTFSVIKSWKGVRSTELTVANFVGPESVIFRKGRNYLVFAWHNENKLTTGACSALGLESAGDAVQSLNRVQAHRRSLRG